MTPLAPASISEKELVQPSKTADSTDKSHTHLSSQVVPVDLKSKSMALKLASDSSRLPCLSSQLEKVEEVIIRPHGHDKLLQIPEPDEDKTEVVWRSATPPREFRDATLDEAKYLCLTPRALKVCQSEKYITLKLERSELDEIDVYGFSRKSEGTSLDNFEENIEKCKADLQEIFEREDFKNGAPIVISFPFRNSKTQGTADHVVALVKEGGKLIIYEPNQENNHEALKGYLKDEALKQYLVDVEVVSISLGYHLNNDAYKKFSPISVGRSILREGTPVDKRSCYPLAIALAQDVIAIAKGRKGEGEGIIEKFKSFGSEARFSDKAIRKLSKQPEDKQKAVMSELVKFDTTYVSATGPEKEGSKVPATIVE